MPQLDYNQISASLAGIKDRALNVQSSLSGLKAADLSSPDQTAPVDIQTLSRSLTSALPTQTGQATEEKSLMEKFAERRKLAEGGASAQAELIKSQAGTEKGLAEEQLGRQLTSEAEARRGFATNTAVVRNIEDTGRRRIKDIEKARDELLLKNDVAKAGRLDDLLVQEQNLITESRQKYLSNLMGLAGGITSLLGFETPEQKRTRELASSTKTSVMNLGAQAPGAGITEADSYDTAITKYKNSPEYKQNVRKGEMEIAKLQKEASMPLVSPPSSYNEWAYAGGQKGTGKTYTEWVQQKNPPTEFQSITAAYAGRIGQAIDTFNSLEDKITKYTTAEYAGLKVLPNFLQPATIQDQLQAERNFVNAVLRRESGAVISQSEFANAEKQYFPRPGDGPEVLAQKKQNREIVFNSFANAAGQAYVPYQDLLKGETPQGRSLSGPTPQENKGQIGDLSNNMFADVFKSITTKGK